jgi:hypothetical protein
LAAMLRELPEPGRSDKTALPESRQALQGWKRLAPAKARLPFPWLLVAAAAHWMAERVSYMTVVIVLAFVCHLRPGVAAKLVIQQFTPHLKARAASQPIGPEHVWHVSLHPQEWEMSSKTGAFDEAVEP